MIIKKDYSFTDLQNACWSGAEKTLDVIMEHDCENAFMSLLEEIFDEPTLTEVNDFLRFDDDYIYDVLGIEEE